MYTVSKVRKGTDCGMVIIRMSGGIGNQMFQYALYLKLVSLGREVKFDDVTEYEHENARPVMLAVFGIDYPRADKYEVTGLTDASMKLKDRIRRRLLGRRSREYHEFSVNYDSEVLKLEDAYLCGCFQSERYFKDIEDEVRRVFQFKLCELPKEMRELADSYGRQLERSMSAGIHIRRGDYLNASDVYGGICTDAYYNKAISYILERYPETHFFVFTNDVFWAEKWCEVKNSSLGNHFTVVKGTDEKTGYIDLMLMSRCKNYIIANSSFSWWGAWLGNAPDKCVVAPVKWLNNKDCEDIYTPDMVRVDAGGRIVSGRI